MKKIFLALLLCLFAIALFSQELTPTCENGKYGFKNGTGEIIIPFEFDEVDNFYGGLAAVKQNNKWGFINPNAVRVIPIKYDLVEAFIKGVAIVNIGAKKNADSYYSGGKWGIINDLGKELTPIQFDMINGDEVSELLRVNVGGIKHPESGNFMGGKWGLIDKAGIQIIPIKYDYISDDMMQLGLGGKWIIDSGEGVDQPGFDEFGNEQITKVYGVPKPRHIEGKYGVIDWNGKIITSLKYNLIKKWDSDLTAVTIDTLGVKVENDFICGGKWGFVDKATGKEVTPLKYNYIKKSKEEGVTIIATDYSYNNNGDVGGKWGFLDKTGKEITLIYDEIQEFQDGLAIVKLNGKYGFVDKTGKQVISCLYSAAYNFNEGIAIVYINSEEFRIDKTGKRIKQ